jgi:uncharacterized protein YaeQ
MTVKLEKCCETPDMFFCYGHSNRKIAVWICQQCNNIQVFTNSGVTFSAYPEEERMIKQIKTQEDWRQKGR